MSKPLTKEKKLPKLRFDFNKAVRDVRKDHPALKKNTVFINAAKENWPEDIDQQAPRLAANDDVMDTLEETVEDARSLRSSFCEAVKTDRGRIIQAVVLHQDDYTLYDSKNRAIDDIGTFDHETAHALHSDAQGTLGENTADAYAVLRHLQRFDGQKTDIDYCGWKRAFIFMTSGVTSHLTTFTVDKILIDNDTAHFVNLTPRQTSVIARAYAEKYAPKGKAMKRLKDDFKPLRQKKLSAASFRKLAGITLAAPENSPTFYLGARVLTDALKDGQATLDGKTVKLQGAYWQRLQKKLEAKLDKLPAQHSLRKAVQRGMK